MQIINCLQGSYEWHALRAGRFTATDAETVKTAGEGLDTLSYEIAAFQITGQLPELISTPAMERGKILEPQARQAYIAATGQEVQEVGFCALNEYAGCSPDGLVGTEGLIEIKCKTAPHHLFAVVNDWVDPKHDWQMQWQLMVTERKWCDYVLYNPDFTENPLYIKTILRDEEKIAKLREGLNKGILMVNQHITKYGDVYKILEESVL